MTTAYRFPGEPKRQVEPFDLVYDEKKRAWVGREPSGNESLPTLPYDFMPKPKKR